MFCSKCGKEIGNEEKFCPSCGTPADAAPSKLAHANVKSGDIKKTVGDFYNKCLGSIRTIGVDSNLYVGYMLNLLLAWIMLNTPIFAFSMKVLEGFTNIDMGASLGFGQFNSIMSLVGRATDMGGFGVIFGILSFIFNVAVIASIVMAVIPVVTGKKTSKEAILVGLICSIVTLAIFCIVWLIMIIICAVASNEMRGAGSVSMGPSLAGYWFLLFEIISIVLSAKIMKDLKKN